MSDTPENGAAPAAEAAQPNPVKMQVLGQFIRDMSFENVAAQKGLTGNVDPDIQVQVNLDARKRADNQYDIATKLKVTSKNKADDSTIFLLELDYVGIFQVENVPDEQLHPFLLIECPRQTFPYVRRIVGDISRDGGFPPLNLEQIDFVALYRNELQRRAAAQQAEGAGTA
jgi:preprotein translocase subunit SecB